MTSSILRKYLFKSNFADGNDICFGFRHRRSLKILNQDLSKLSKWLYENCMTVNPDKCH